MKYEITISYPNRPNVEREIAELDLVRNSIVVPIDIEYRYHYVLEEGIGQNGYSSSESVRDNDTDEGVLG